MIRHKVGRRPPLLGAFGWRRDPPKSKLYFESLAYALRHTLPLFISRRYMRSPATLRRRRRRLQTIGRLKSNFSRARVDSLFHLGRVLLNARDVCYNVY
jgi:hypothetical protein